MNTAFALPDSLQKYAGKIADADSHEMMPLQEWEKLFGADIRPLCDAFTCNGETDEINTYSKANNGNHPNIPGYQGDTHKIDANVVNVKGCRLSPGVRDPNRRIEVMNVMGVGRQLMFPGSAGLFGMTLLNLHDNKEFMATIIGDRKAYAEHCIDLYNNWLAEEFAKTADRIRPVAPVYGDTVQELYDHTKQLLDRGLRAIWLPASVPPGGRSPASLELDRYWAMLAEAQCAVTLHVGSEGKFFDSLVWRDAAAFEGFKAISEFRVDPWSVSVYHWQCQNYLSTMINGGVFVRHPQLRFAVVELGGFWVGHMMETLDLWYKSLNPSSTNAHKLPELPSTYVKQNVRATVYPFEDPGLYIERYGLDDVLCFATDYPHAEGGKDIFNGMYDKVKRLGPDVVEKFFVKNAQWLLPD